MENEIDKISLLNELAEQIKQCKKCEISKYRTNAVVGEGNPYSSIMFIGEAPGRTEDETGRPFVGNAGKFLDSMLNAAGFSREDVYITNVIKTRPPDNRDPQPEEIINCRHYLDRQIEIINPKVIVTLGRYSMGLFLPGVTISKVHGTPFLKKSRIYMPMYHPAATLHQPSLKEVAIKDMLKLPRLVELIETGRVTLQNENNGQDIIVPNDDTNVSKNAEINGKINKTLVKNNKTEIDENSISEKESVELVDTPDINTASDFSINKETNNIVNNKQATEIADNNDYQLRLFDF